MGGAESPVRVRERASAWYYANKKRALARYAINTPLWRQRNPERRALLQFRAHLKRAYGISVEEYDRIALAQKDLCAICGGPPLPKRGKTTRLEVDHDHLTGRVRGLLCNTCNTALHKLEHDITWADKAKAYLQKGIT